MAVVQRRQLLLDALVGSPPPVVDDVLAALDRLLAAPYAPVDVACSEVKLGRHDGARIAHLGHDLWVTFTIEEQVPPTLQTVVQLRDARFLAVPDSLPVLPGSALASGQRPARREERPRWWRRALVATTVTFVAVEVVRAIRRRR